MEMQARNRRMDRIQTIRQTNGSNGNYGLNFKDHEEYCALESLLKLNATNILSSGELEKEGLSKYVSEWAKYAGFDFDSLRSNDKLSLFNIAGIVLRRRDGINDVIKELNTLYKDIADSMAHNEMTDKLNTVDQYTEDRKQLVVNGGKLATLINKCSIHIGKALQYHSYSRMPNYLTPEEALYKMDELRRQAAFLGFYDINSGANEGLIASHLQEFANRQFGFLESVISATNMVTSKNRDILGIKSSHDVYTSDNPYIATLRRLTNGEKCKDDVYTIGVKNIIKDVYGITDTDSVYGAKAAYGKAFNALRNGEYTVAETLQQCAITEGRGRGPYNTELSPQKNIGRR